MGRVYKARDLLSSRTVALKLVRPELSEDEIILKRLKRELEVTTRTDSPHVVKTYDLDQIEDVSYIAMEFIDGETLSEVLRREKALDTDTTIKYSLQILEGLKAAHEKQVIHRDLKPSNIMVDSSGKAVITDFGLARPTGDVTKISKTASILGTPQYVAPEQWKGQAPTFATDIYAFGIIMYEMLCGKTPFSSDTDFGYLQQHLSTAPEFREEKLSKLPGFLKNLILKCLEKSPEHRYSHVDEIVADIEKQKVKGETTDSVRRAAQKIPRKLWVTVLVLLFLGSGYFVSDRYLIKKKPEKFHFAVLPFKALSDEKKVVSWSKKLPSFISSSLSEEQKIAIIPYLEVRSKYGSKAPEEAVETLTDCTSTEYVVSGRINKDKDIYLVNVTVHKKGETKPFFTKLFKTKGKSLFAFNSRISRTIKEFFKIQTLTNYVKNKFKAYTITTSSVDAKEYYTIGYNIFSKGKYSDALIYLEKAVELDPKFASAYTLMSSCHRRMGHTNKSKDFISKAYNLRHILTKPEQIAIDYQYRDNFKLDIKPLIKNSEERLSKNPNDEELMLSLAIDYIILEQWDKAISLFYKLNQQTNRPVVKRYLITAYAKSNQIEKAKKIVNELKNIKPVPAAYSFYNWTMKILESRYNEAIDIGKSRIFMFPQNEKGYRYTGLAYMFNGNLNEATKTFDRIIERTKETEAKIKSLLYKASILLYKGSIKKSEKILLQCIKLSDTNKLPSQRNEAIRLLIKLHILKREYKLGIQLFEKLLLLNDNQQIDTDLVSCLLGSICYAQVNNYEKLVDISKRINKLSPNVYRSTEHICKELIANIYSQNIDMKLVISAYSNYRCEFSTFADHHALFLYNIANKYHSIKEYNKAIFYYKKLQSLSFGRIYYGEYYVLSFYKSGCILQELGNISESKLQLSKFLNLWSEGDKSLFPQLEDAKKRLTKLTR